MNKSNYKSGFDMHYNATENIQAKAKELRKQMTPAEKLLWTKLNNKQVLGLKFRRQHPIDIFIVDFYCHKAKLVIEIDGEYHKDKSVSEYDKGRTSELEQYGLTVVRFTNKEVLNDVGLVINQINELKCVSSLNGI